MERTENSIPKAARAGAIGLRTPGTARRPGPAPCCRDDRVDPGATCPIVTSVIQALCRVRRCEILAQASHLGRSSLVVECFDHDIKGE
eukprot:6321971-Prymnesium_polylepis.2